MTGDWATQATGQTLPDQAGLDRAGSGAASAPRPPGLWLSRLALSDFRNYAEASVTLAAEPLLLTGPNGAGKTNLLEAVSLLAPGRGLRRAKPADLQRLAGGGPWAVAATLETPAGPRQLGTGRDPASAPGGQTASERRLVRIDGRNARAQSSFAELLDVVWLTPQMDGLWREGAGERRRFLDRLVFAFDPAHAGRVSGYESALRQRTRLLQEGAADAQWLTALEEGLAERGVAIAAARAALIARLNQAIESAPASGFPRAALSLSGSVDAWLARESALAAEERLRAAFVEARGRDAEQGGSAVGPQRSDLEARHLEKNAPAGLCSTGEQKALLVGLVLAHARLVALERARPPLLLLDEVAAHLDATRRDALYDELLSLGLQAWLTGTEPAVFAALAGRAQSLRVSDGQVHIGS
ncbi:MAG: DNA replication/repair protein RecF [Rhodospirillales bacterium]